MNYFVLAGVLAGMAATALTGVCAGYRSLVITHRNTDVPSFLAINDGANMRIEGNSVIFSSDNNELEARLDNISHIGFSEIPTETLPEFPDGKDSPTTGVVPVGNDCRFSMNGRVMSLSGTLTSSVAVYRHDGRKAPVRAESDGQSAAIDFSTVAPGVYIVTTDTMSFKIIVK